MFKSISYLTISIDLYEILAPEVSLLLTGETSSHVPKKHSFQTLQDLTTRLYLKILRN